MGIRFIIAAALVTLVFASIPSLAQDALPRYKLEVGQEIQYQDSSDSRYDKGGGYHFEKNWTLWVIGHSGDGGWRVFERYVVVSQKLDRAGRAPTTQTTEIGRLNVSQDGQVEVTDGYAARLDPLAVLPQLPKAPTDKTWLAKLPIGGTFDYSALPNNTTNDFAFRYDDHWNHNSFYLIKHFGTLHFDSQRGLLSSGSENWVQGYPRQSKSTGTLTLKSVQMKGAAFVQRLTTESDVYFKVASDYEHAATAARKDPAKTDSIMKEAENELKDARSQVTLPPLTDLLDKALSLHDRVVADMRKDIKEAAEHVAAVLNKPAAGWQLIDLSGETHRLSDYRGKVVLLDFWDSGCGFCIESMPQMNQVADDFKTEPVAVLGMNTDDDATAAAYIAGKMKLRYPTLLAPHVPDSYGVDGYPTLILIDSEGIVRDVLVGNIDQLREKMDQAVRKLLPAKGGLKP